MGRMKRMLRDACNLRSNMDNDHGVEGPSAKRSCLMDSSEGNVGGCSKRNELLNTEVAHEMNEYDEADHCILPEAFALPEPTYCTHCNAKKFACEGRCFCCSDGVISLHTNDSPNELFNLFTSNSEESKHFLKYVRAYNNNFSFTSFGVKSDGTVNITSKGIYTFRVQGQVYHYLNQLSPSGDQPSYLQLYFFDTENELANRIAIYDKLNEVVLGKLIDILAKNPYGEFFRSLNTISTLNNHTICIRSDPNLDQRVYNAPIASQVAAVWIDNNSEVEPTKRDIVVFSHSGSSHKVNYFYGCYDPLQYPLLFPFGDVGWNEYITRGSRSNGTGNNIQGDGVSQCDISSVNLLNGEIRGDEQRGRRTIVSCREYYCYKLQIRSSSRSHLLHAGRLLQQYVVDMYVKLETSRLDYIRLNQRQIRAELYQGIVDSISVGERHGSRIGRRVVLPASFIGGPRDMRKRYMDAMTLVQRFGKPDIFLTMTCNPNWREIKDELRFNDEVQNRPDLVTRIFRAKLEELKKDIVRRHVFGRVAGYVYVVEFQKRGLPHVHFLIILQSDSKIIDPSTFDRFVCAELPDKDKYPHLYAAVVKHMMHGPCGALNPKNICMLAKEKCKNHYPKHFHEETCHGKDSYPKYRRRDDGKVAKVRGSILDNRWVIPYNPHLLSKYDCHMNVEICSTIKAVKYLYKYIYKGHDKIALQVCLDATNNEIDEIERFQSGRWVSPPEAMWRIYGFALNEIHPSVITLHLHLEGKQMISFKDGDMLEDVVTDGNKCSSMLMEYFALNVVDEFARSLLYKQIPEFYVWNQRMKKWTMRKQGRVIGRIVAVNPSEGERYYLRLLLNHIKGCSSFEDLKIVNGVVVDSFQQAAVLLRYVEDDNCLESCMEEAAMYQMPFALRRLFATILFYCNPSSGRHLWITFKERMSEDYVHLNGNRHEAEKKVLQHVNQMLQAMGKSLADYDMRDELLNIEEQMNDDIEVREELEVEVCSSDIKIVEKLNELQRYAYECIISRVFNDGGGAFFVDGPGGTGKTFLYRALLSTVRRKNLIGLATASSGVAASILPGGRTAHSRFKLPIHIDCNKTCNVSKQSGLAKLLMLTRLIIWDEAPMVNKEAIEALDRMLRDVCDNDVVFGGKVVVFGGDFRQVLPVVRKGTKHDIINACMVKSYLWPKMQRIKLVENMRAKLDKSFSEYVLRVGNGVEKEFRDHYIKLPAGMALQFVDQKTSLRNLINLIFGKLSDYACNLDAMSSRAILTTKNEFVDEINQLLIEEFEGPPIKYYSFDRVTDSSQHNVTEEFLNSLYLNGIPPHELILKKNCPVMLLRNINPAEGLCNGTRLICRQFERNVIDAEIIHGDYKGKRVFLPRIPFVPNEADKCPFQFKRTQFPIRLCFAMTINKAQGQTLDSVGIFLPEPVFSHGQLYVALSRARCASDVKVLIRSPSSKAYYDRTKNIVYRDLLKHVDADGYHEIF